MGNIFSFIHAADLHLDSPFRGMSAVGEIESGEFRHVLNRLRDCTFIALTRLVDLCLQEKVDFLLLAGDIYDVANRSLRAQIRFQEEMRRLKEAAISAYIVHGNHDYTAGWSADLGYPDTVHVFSDREVECLPVIKQGREVARVCGISFPQAAVTENLSLRFFKKPDGPFSIAMLHSNVGSIEGYDNYAPCKLDDLLERGFDYWALGHIHSYTVLHTQYATVIYPGCHQGRSIREMGSKGCVLARVKDNRSLEFEFRATDNTRWQVLEVPITGLSTDQELLDVLDRSILELKRGAPGIAWVARIILSGRGSLYPSLKRPSYLPDLLYRLRCLYARESEEFIWPESITLNASKDIDQLKAIDSPTLIGDFLKLARQAVVDPELSHHLMQGLRGPYESHQIGRYLEEPGREDLARMLGEAEKLGLDLLWEEGD